MYMMCDMFLLFLFQVSVLLKLFVPRSLFTYAVVASGNTARVTTSSDLLALSGQTLYITDKVYTFHILTYF